MAMDFLFLANTGLEYTQMLKPSCFSLPPKAVLISFYNIYISFILVKRNPQQIVLIKIQWMLFLFFSSLYSLVPYFLASDTREKVSAEYNFQIIESNYQLYLERRIYD